MLDFRLAPRGSPTWGLGWLQQGLVSGRQGEAVPGQGLFPLRPAAVPSLSPDSAADRRGLGEGFPGQL